MLTGSEIEADTVELNSDLSIRTIPAGKCAKFVIKSNVVPAVSEAWNEIWNIPLERTFSVVVK